MINLTYCPAEAEIDAIKSMTNDARADLAARINAKLPFSIFDAVEGKEGKEIICPNCGSGSGKNHTGVKPTFENGKWLYNCFACGSFSGDLIKIIADANNLSTQGADYFSVLAIGAKILGENAPLVEVNSRKAQVKKKVAEFNRLSESRKKLPAFIKGKGDNWRGLTLKLLQRLNWGFLPDIYFPDAKKELPAMIIPNDLNGIFARAVDGKNYRNNKPTATTTIFLPNTAELDLIIVEGAINGASILQAVPEPNFGIVASGGTSGNDNVLARLHQLAAAGKKFRVMVAYDNDKGGAGQKAAAKLLVSLKKENIVATSIDITQIADTDLNDILRAEGEGNLAELVNSAVEGAQIELEKAAAQMQARAAEKNCAKDDSDLAAQIENQEKQRQEVEKEIAALAAEKEAAIEKLKSIETFDFDTVFSAEIISGAAFAKLYDKTEYARACVDIQKNNSGNERFLQNWKSAVKDKAAFIAACAEDLKIKASEIAAKIDTLKFQSANDFLRNFELPNNFGISATGEIFKIVKGVPLTICRVPVAITQEYFGVDTEIYKYSLTFKRGSQLKSTPPLEQATLADAKKLVPAVANFGLQINSTNASGVVDYLDAILANNVGKFKKIFTARQFGWNKYNGKDYFLDPRRNCEVEVEGVKYPFVADHMQSQFAKSLTSAGTIDEWKKAYDLTENFPVARFIVAAAIAAPLLKILGLRNFGLYFYGKSRAGKTTALLLGISAVGNEKMVRTFDATKNGLLGAAAEAKDFVFAVDEKQSADRKIAESLSNFVYDYCEGRPRTKLNRDSTLMEGKETRGILVATGETPLYADNVTEGANTRAIQIHIKEVLKQGICADIRRIIKENYGHISPLFVDKLFELGFENLKKLHSDLTKMLAKKNSTILPQYCANIAAVTLAQSILGVILGGDIKSSQVDALKVAAEVLKIVPTINEISDTEREKDFVTSFIAQNSANFEGADNFNKDRCLKFFGRIDHAENFIYIVAGALQNACKDSKYNYSKVVADLSECGFFTPSNKIEKGHKSRLAVVTKKIGGITTRCLRLPLSALEIEDE